MTDMFGQYKSQETRALQSIDSTKYPDTNKDMAANLQRNNQFIDYIASYLQTMQKGVDQANMDFIQRTRDIISNIVILFGGGNPAGIDLGDLQYFLPAIGALLGFDANVPFPLNLFNAAEHFLLGYVIPLDSFLFEIEDIISGWMDAFGISPAFRDEVVEVVEAIGDVADSIGGFFEAIFGLLNIFSLGTGGGGDDTSWLGPFADLWHAATQLLGGFSIADLGSLLDPVFNGLAPWVHELANILEWISDIIDGFSDGLHDIAGILNLGNLFTSFMNLTPSGTFNPITAVGDFISGALKPIGNLLDNLSPIDAGNFFGNFNWGFFTGITGTLPKVNVSGLTNIIANVGSLFNSVDFSVPTVTFPSLNSIFSGPVQQAMNLIDSIGNAWTGLFDTGDWFSGWTQSDANDAAKAAQKTLRELNASVQALQQNNPAADGGNSAFVDLSPYADATNLSSAGFGTTAYTGTGPETLQIVSGKGKFVGGPSSVNYSMALGSLAAYAIYTALPTITTTQKVSAIWASKPGKNPGSGTTFKSNHYLVFRSNVAGTECGRVTFTDASFQFEADISGTITLIGSNHAHAFQAGAIYAVEAGFSGVDRQYRLTCNGTTLITFTESGTTIPVDSSHVYTGVGGFCNEQVVGSIANTAMPGQVAAFAMADDVVPTHQGNSARIYRVSTGGVAVADLTTYPASFLDTIDWVTNDITLTRGHNEVHTIAMTATGGTWTYTVGGQTTAALARNISLSALNTAITGLSSVGSGNVVITGTAGTSYVITYIVGKANTSMGGFTLNTSLLTGGTATPTLTTPGDLANCFKVSVEGLYVIDFRRLLTSGSAAAAGLWVNGNIRAGGTSNDHSYCVDTWWEYLYAGDNVQPGLYVGGTVTGEALGLYQAFKIAKVG